MGVDLDHEGLVGVIEDRDVLDILVVLSAFHQGDVGFAGQIGGGGQADTGFGIEVFKLVEKDILVALEVFLQFAILFFQLSLGCFGFSCILLLPPNLLIQLLPFPLHFLHALFLHFQLPLPLLFTLEIIGIHD